jgi:hypothetical protein
MFNGGVIVKGELVRMWKKVVFKVLLWYLLVGTQIIHDILCTWDIVYTKKECEVFRSSICS